MATVEECELALHRLADRLSEYRDTQSDDAATPDRTLSCTIRDLGVVFAARLERGRVTAIRRVSDPKAVGDAQIRFELTAADLLELVDGTLDAAAAWLTGRLKVGAGVRDLIRLRSFF